MWPNLSVADFNLSDMIHYVVKIDFFFKLKEICDWYLDTTEFVANIDLADMVCGRYFDII